MAGKRDPQVSNPMLVRGIDRVLTVQRPVVLAHIRSVRRGRPDASPEQLIRVLERRYLTAVTTGGALVGASATVPGVGTGSSLVLSGVETAGFLEASALFAQSVAEVHGIVVDDPDRARTLVMTMVLGTAGTDLVKQLAGQATATGTGTGARALWGEMITKSLPRTVDGPYRGSDQGHLSQAIHRRPGHQRRRSAHPVRHRRGDRRQGQPPARAPDRRELARGLRRGTGCLPELARGLPAHAARAPPAA